MSEHDLPRFQYLNRDNRWAGSWRDGLVLDHDGALRLDHLPRLDGAMPVGLADQAADAEAAGIVALPDGTVFYTRPAEHGLWRLDDCGGSGLPAPCVGGPSDQPGGVQLPHGLAWHPGRVALIVADTGNHRLQLFDAATMQLQEIWGGWGRRVRQLASPRGVAVDGAGDVYVLDYGNRRIQKRDMFGNVLPAFWQNARRQLRSNGLALRSPGEIAACPEIDDGLILVLDGGNATLLAFNASGTLVPFTGGPVLDLRARVGEGPIAAMGLAAAPDAIYVGDNAGRRVLRFALDGAYVGEAVGYEGPVAALALALAGGGLLVHPGGGLAPVALSARSAFARTGHVWTGVAWNPSARAEQWHRVKATVALPEGAHLQLFVRRSTSAPPETDVGCAPWAAGALDLVDHLAAAAQQVTRNGQPVTVPPPGEQWVRLPLDATEGVVPGSPGEYLSVGAALSGDGLVSPVLTQVRVDFDRAGWLDYLPVIYREDQRSRQFLSRFLMLFEGLFEDAEHAMDHLPRYFDPGATPQDALTWLAGWLALDVHEDWPPGLTRRVLAEAFETYGWRGTAEGLRRAIDLFTSVSVHIQEPILNAAWWALPGIGVGGAENGGSCGAASVSELTRPEHSVLGFTTMLAPAEPQGAVVGTTAVLDGSHLIDGEAYGAPLFEDVAHQFSVLLYRGRRFGEQALAAVREVIERERPAHTTYHLCVVEPALRVGFQARVGVDAIVAGPPAPAPLDGALATGQGLVLAGNPAGRIGDESRIGRSTRLDAIP